MRDKHTSITIATAINSAGGKFDKNDPRMNSRIMSDTSSSQTWRKVSESGGASSPSPISQFGNTSTTRPPTSRGSPKKNPVDVGDEIEAEAIASKTKYRPGTASGKKGDCIIT
ncbi:hypothetical protein HK096_011019 [Nowakowskiella sp. JEL0078]|nr:hypothetical protein HK096_011019 [Nowakowskiella sp. JEL0078]